MLLYYYAVVVKPQNIDIFMFSEILMQSKNIVAISGCYSTLFGHNHTLWIMNVY